jgi:hypothetical protein
MQWNFCIICKALKHDARFTDNFRPIYVLRRADYTVRFYFTGSIYRKVANVFRCM